LWLPDENGEFGNAEDGFLGDCFTSSMRQGSDGHKGVQLRPASQVLKHPDRWMYQEIEMSDEQLTDLRIMSKRLADRKIGYGIKEILSFFIPFGRWNSEDYICSEVVWYVLYCVSILSEDKIFSPRRMSKRIYKYCDYPITELKPLRGRQ
jgi:hypothetical protein